MLNVLDLFSGIGGFSLGLEATGGFRTVAFCERDRFCRAVIERHWPKVARFRDVRFLDRGKLANFLPIDVICGGFPCQDISVAGKGAGIDGERSGLWADYARLIGELRPRYAIVENVSALLGRGLDRVLGDLAALGFDAEWHCIPASAVGAPHRRDRIWIVAYPAGWRGERRRSERLGASSAGAFDVSAGPGTRSEDVAHANDTRELQPQGSEQVERRRPSDSGETLADADQPRLSLGKLLAGIRRGEECGEAREVAAVDGELPRAAHDAQDSARAGRCISTRSWRIEPNVGRVAHGVPNRVDRLRSLGNAVVPQIPEIIGRAILEAEGF